MGRGFCLVSRENRVAFVCPRLRPAIGCIVGRMGNEVVRFPDGRVPSLDDGVRVLAAVEATGAITVSDYWLCGPGGSVYEVGTLTNDAIAGQRIVAYSRCEIQRVPTGGRVTGKVLFDGLAGFGAYQ